MSNVEQIKDFAEWLEALQKDVKDLTAEVFRLKTQVETLQLKQDARNVPAHWTPSQREARFGRVRDDRDHDRDEEEEDCFGPLNPDGSCMYR